MLIHLEGTVTDDVINFDLPQVYFKQGQIVSVLEIMLDYRQSIQDLHGYISSSLVDKSPCNPKQQIFNFHQTWVSNFAHFTPTHLLHYKIQCLDLNSSVFKIHFFTWNKNVKRKNIKNLIERVYLTLEITDARL